MPGSIPDAILSWQLTAPNQPFELRTTPVPDIGPEDALVQVAGCGVCHTDVGFFQGTVQTRASLPLTLGHEISGRVIAAGATVDELEGRNVVVPAVIPCGTCELCQRGRGNACRAQCMPGNDLHGGFASHVVVPGRSLCVVDELYDHDLAELSVIADAVTTPYMALRRAEVQRGDLCIIVGVGGVGGFAVQLAASLGATVIALDVEDHKLERLRHYGASFSMNTDKQSPRTIQREIRTLVQRENLPPYAWKVFEMSGTPLGQEIAYALLTFAGSLAVVGFTRDKVSLRLSNLMAFDATAIGTWGCLPEYYKDVVHLALSGQIKLRPFCSRHPMGEIREVFRCVQENAMRTRAILEPDF